ncbi:uncharacterized protein si:dkey-10c21.1 [Pygocentrus nattereri]|uniref:Si:dkey-10c21.1 n=1 Tax=Pygocentrus nattereri TaxID=42514 RepID=A0AAR2LZV6_PYGNA|nr:uncharacterized protein si:dkey-10c21.1 [Pygocentrus nattereri]XP_017547056.1 uncharacterized protein si:dkey-10c21.1 [Pygocentrus nattereri]
MDEKDIIRRKKRDLIFWLSLNDMILHELQSEGLITDDEYEKLKQFEERNGVQKMIGELLDRIMKKGTLVCGQFLNLLRDKNVNESCPELREWITGVNTSGPSAASGTKSSSAANNPNSSTSHAGNQTIADNEEFLKRNRCALIDKVKNVVRITDNLHLTDEMRALVQAEPTDQAKMRKVLEFTNSSTAAKRLVEALWEHAGDVMEDLTRA